MSNLTNDRFFQEKAALSFLVKFCLSGAHLLKASQFLENHTENEVKGYELLYDLSQFCEDNAIPFLVHIDWTAETEEFLYFLDRILTENFGLEIISDLDRVAQNHSLDQVMQQCDQLLERHGLQLGLADDDTDSYISFVHRIENTEEIRSLLKQNSFLYQETPNL